MQIEIETLDRELADYLMGTVSLKAGTSTDIPGPAKLTFEVIYTGKTLGTEVVLLALNFGIGVASGLVSNWLFEKLKGKGRATKLRIDHKEVEIEEGAIKRIIENRIELDE